MKNTYAIALADLYDNTNKITLVEAKDSHEAMVMFSEEQKLPDACKMSTQEIIMRLFDGDMLVSEPKLVIGVTEVNKC